MNFRLTAALFGVVTLLLVGLLASALTHDPKAAVPTGRAVASLAEAGVTEADIDSVILHRTEPSDSELIFAKPDKDQPWAQTEPTPAKLDQAEVAGLVRDLFRLNAVPYGELTENLTAQGLNPPTLTATLKGIGQSLTINFGRTTAGGSEKAVTFVSTSANPERAFAVKRSDLSGLFRAGPAVPADGLAGPMAKWSGDYRVRRFLNESRDPANDTTQIQVEGGGKSLELSKTNGAWRFLQPVGYGRADEAGDSAPQPSGSPFTGVRPLLIALSNLTGGPEDYVESPDPAVTGLDGASAIKILLRGPTRNEEVVIGKPVVGPDGKPAAPPRVYARVPGESGAAKVAFDRLNSLWATLDAPQTLRDRDLVAPTQRERLDAIDLIVGGNTTQLRKVPVDGKPQWVVYGGPAGPVSAKSDPIIQLVEILTSPRAGRDMLPGLNDTAVTGAALQATIKAWSGVAPASAANPKPGQFPPEPVPSGAPAVELALGKRDGESVIARGTIGDSKADYKLPEALVNLALTPRLAWVDPKFLTFDPQQVERFTYSRAGTTYEIAKSGTGWNYTQPDAMKGKPADAPRILPLLNQLAGITAQTVLAEKPSAEQLQRASLDVVAPRLPVTVYMGGDKKITYEFGADTEDGQAVYFRQLGVPMLTRADRRPLDLLLGSDLRDRTVYRIDPAAVTRVQLRGRMGTPTIQTVVVTKQGTEWTSANAGLKPDTAKVNQLIALLAAPRCENFVGPGKTEYGTDVTQEAKAIEIVVDRKDGPPVSLVFGSDAPGGLVYGASSAATEAFLIDAGAYRGMVTTSGGLGK